jgi:DNA-binding transcriptional MerR regulator
MARGKGASYGEEHLSRLRLIRRLSDQRVPLVEIRRRLAGLNLSDIRALLAAEERLGAELEVAERSQSAREYVSALLRRSQQTRISSASNREPPPDSGATRRERVNSLAEEAVTIPPALATTAPVSEADLPWRRLELAPGVELHVRADAEERSGPLIRRLLEQASRD